MQRIGVVLAGGKATRLNNKILLPLKSGYPMICSSIDYLLRLKLQKIVILDKELSILPKLLYQLYGELEFMTDNFSGIPSALRSLADKYKAELIVVCADNIYSVESVPLIENSGVVRKVPVAESQRLTTFVDGKWVRGQVSGTALTTPWILNSVSIQLSVSDGLEDLFNELKIRPNLCPANKWADLGTEDSYLRYWNA